ncbi:hypothetical protein LCGC14_1824310 [marine sediment metagenome]|uniref:Uncharacterized protein n=1 Tax=marine sediment metagenome TaxID=412755 RepID=A0A0F9JHG5_9ZZZZ
MSSCLGKSTDKDRTIPKEYAGVVYNFVEKAVAETDTKGKTTDEVFGEIYTRFRTEVSVWERHPKLKELFLCRLKYLDCTEAGKELNKIINKMCQEKIKKDTYIENLELCAVVMRDCLSDAKRISDESAKVISTLEKIGDDLNGESYVG